MPAADRVVIVGAGISGLAIAHQMAPDHEVIVLEKTGIMGDTSSRASGVISLGLEPVPPRWKTTALETFRELDGDGSFRFTERETIRLHPESAMTATHQQPDPDQYLDREALLAAYPDTFRDLSDYTGGEIYTDTGMVDVLEYAITLKSLAEAAGARIYRDHQVSGLRVDNDSVIGVTTEYGLIDAETVVYATGWRLRDQLREFVKVPIRPLRWNAIVMEPTESLPSGMPMGSEPALRMYWRPLTTGDLLVGGNEHLVQNPAEQPMAIDEQFRERVVSDLVPVFPGVEDGVIRQEDCCPTADTATPDGIPIVDRPNESPAGLVIATGFHGRGVMLSPITARAVRSLVTREPTEISLDPLRVDRFEDRSPEFEYRSHWE